MLAVYGEEDKFVPPASSADRIKHGLEESGNREHSFLFFAEADHSLLISKDDYGHPPGKLQYTPGYVETMTGWVPGEGAGRVPDTLRSASGAATSRLSTSKARIPDPGRTPFYGGTLAQMGSAATFVAVFGAIVACRGSRPLRRRATTVRGARSRSVGTLSGDGRERARPVPARRPRSVSGGDDPGRGPRPAVWLYVAEAAQRALRCAHADACGV